MLESPINNYEPMQEFVARLFERGIHKIVIEPYAYYIDSVPWLDCYNGWNFFI